MDKENTVQECSRHFRDTRKKKGNHESFQKTELETIILNETTWTEKDR